MKKMTIEKAIEYCKGKRVAIHTPTQEVYDKFGKYVDKSEYRWLSKNYFSKYRERTCVNLENGHTCFSPYGYYKNFHWEIVELIPDNSLTITIHSDGHKVVSACCKDITVEAKCNDTDTFNLSKGSHIALKRLIDKMNEPAKLGSKFKTGDIVEIISNSICAWDESIGLQGIITDITRDYFTVTFPVKICDFYDWNYLSKDLKLIRKASK